MAENVPVRRVEVSFVGAAPARQVERASGVSEVETDGSTLRCLVCGSFQPFLEALRGHEVVGLSATAPADDTHVTTTPAGATPGGPAPGGAAFAGRTPSRPAPALVPPDSRGDSHA